MSQILFRNSALSLLVTWCFCWHMLGEANLAMAQHSAARSASSSVEAIQDRIEQHLAAGEYPRVQALLDQLPDRQADEARAKLFAHQLESGATRGAILSALQIQDEQRRRLELARYRSAMTMGSRRTNPDSGTYSKSPAIPSTSGGDPSKNETGGISGGRSGGITEEDFQPLIDLIINTIATDKWPDAGGPFAIRSYPSGVYVDHAGTLQRLKVDNARVNSRRSRFLPQATIPAWFEDSGNRDPHWNSQLRKVSLNRLERAAELQYALGIPMDETILNFAGLTAIQYVFIDPEKKEIIVAGPAGPWHRDPLGRAINRDTGKPVLQLEDFVVTLRNAFDGQGLFGCTIDPRPDNLTAVQALLKKSRSPGRAWKDKLRQTLGQQDVIVFGIDPGTHAARILVEADYHMKLVGMGLEASIPQVPSYLDRLTFTALETGPPTDVIRWWFTAKEAELACDDQFERFELTGTGVKVLSELELLGKNGQRIHTGQSSGPAEGFARDFTRHFQSMANRYPVYHELQNLFSLALVANLIKQQQLDQRTGRELAFFKQGNLSGAVTFPVRLSNPPRQVDSVMNERVLEHRKSNQTSRNTVIGISGGVEFALLPMVRSEGMKPLENAERLRPHQAISDSEKLAWWWD